MANNFNFNGGEMWLYIKQRKRDELEDKVEALLMCLCKVKADCAHCWQMSLAHLMTFYLLQSPLWSLSGNGMIFHPSLFKLWVIRLDNGVLYANNCCLVVVAMTIEQDVLKNSVSYTCRLLTSPGLGHTHNAAHRLQIDECVEILTMLSLCANVHNTTFT